MSLVSARHVIPATAVAAAAIIVIIVVVVVIVMASIFAIIVTGVCVQEGLQLCVRGLEVDE